MQWFRMYAEAVDDEKLRLLGFDDRWFFVAILCLKAQGILDESNEELRRRKICVKLGLDSLELETLMKRLETVGLVSSDFQPRQWKKRQFVSDSSTSRVRKFRQRSRNVSVTPSESESETETEQKQSKKALKRARRVPEDFVPDLEIARSQCPGIDAEREAQKFRDWEFKAPKSDWGACWRNWVGNCRESGKYARITAPTKTLPAGYENVKW